MAGASSHTPAGDSPPSRSGHQPPDDVITKVGVVGAGLMGVGIAETVARAGLEVVTYEIDPAVLEDAKLRLTKSIEAGIRGGKFSKSEASGAIGRVAFSSELADLSSSQLVVEAVTEDERTKRNVLSQLDSVLGPEAIIASNTSSIPIAHLASATERAERVLGLHFFSPAPVMKLVEVVVALQTSDQTIEDAERFVRLLGKTPIRTKDRAGFIVNLLLVPYLMAAVRLHEENFAEPETIDAAMRLGCSHPMGPLALCDFIGLDVLLAVSEALYDEFKRPEFAPPILLKRMVSAGRLGRKTSTGFYDYGHEKD